MQFCLELAILAARAGGQHARLNRHRSSDVHKAFAHDIKLQLDLECQARVVDTIQRHAPTHAILAEEDEGDVAALPGGPARASARAADAPLWIVDPIDGTVNYFHGLPMWCCSVAVQQGGRTLAGAVYAPDLGELYTATADGPALLNGEPLRTSETATLEDAIFLTGLSQKNESDAVPATLVERLAQSVQKIRVLGAAALDICRVARGHADAYWEPAIHLWDMAAAGLIAERAGARTTVLSRRGTRVSFVATNAHIHDAVTQLLTARHSP